MCPVCNCLIRVIKASFNDPPANITIGAPLFSNHTDTGMRAGRKLTPCAGSLTPLIRQPFGIYFEEET